ncbi:DUF983 domain-containing protein [Niastella yeongjuensis]|uniref:DUF983 domain-containing protein n=1 Tax=Niastella yeongjuensis TaxID=354355 RepID=A0A1V9F8I7_9BACT|nr:DUF983 domain-containing protein [Niastella yeongjuensis]OQP54536.1 DUF983 domain-containing protein [Niastella yeongjuensis]SEN98117.1 Protein of unknown function [Niastella yeongjuensis]
MCAEKKDQKPGYIWSLLHHKCARCRAGNMFQTKNAYRLKYLLKMYDKCPVCDQRMEIEVGFYYGTGYVSYALTVAFSVTTFVAWWVLIGMSVHDNRFFWWLGLNITLLVMLQPFLMRLSRAIWLSFFVRYNANWQAEKENTSAPEL